MQSLADCAGTGVQFCHHALDRLAQAQCVDVNTEHIGTGIQSLQAAEVLRAFLDFQRSHDLLKFSQQGIGGGGECVACIIDANRKCMWRMR